MSNPQHALTIFTKGHCMFDLANIFAASTPDVEPLLYKQQIK